MNAVWSMTDAMLWTMSEPMFVPAVILGLFVVAFVTLFLRNRD